jgi:hypothetical protein
MCDRIAKVQPLTANTFCPSLGKRKKRRRSRLSAVILALSLTICHTIRSSSVVDRPRTRDGGALQALSPQLYVQLNPPDQSYIQRSSALTKLRSTHISHIARSAVALTKRM